MGIDDPRLLLGELSSQLLLSNFSDSSDLEKLEESLSQLQRACAPDQWEIVANVADAILAAHTSEEVRTCAEALAECCADLERYLYLTDTHVEPASETDEVAESSPASSSTDVDAWGFDEEDECAPKVDDAPGAVVSFVMGGTGPANPIKDDGQGITTVSRDTEEIENMIDFYSEAQEAIERNERVLLERSSGELDTDGIGALFRAFHTIKGVAGFVGLGQPTQLAHSTESLLGEVRRGDIATSHEILDLLLESNNCMQTLVESVRLAIEASTTVPFAEQVDDLCLRIDSAASQIQELPPSPSREPQSQGSSSPPAPPALVPVQVPTSAADDAGPISAGLPGRSQGSTQIRDTLKVNVDRVDSLVEMVGEMVIVESMIAGDEDLRNIRSPKLKNNVRQMAKITRDLQKVALQLRMVPIRGLFTRTARMVRELSRQCGKQILFSAEGEGTEMDRNMVEHLADPLLHIIRNAVDHGVESTEERRAAGKPYEGSIRVSAYHESSNLVIEVADDGAGLDPEELVARGRARGLVAAGQSLSESEAYDLIFAPGFSTKDRVTDLSGRGVGMDVVRKNLKSMRGRIRIQSKPSVGTTFRLVLPLTLAIIDGTLISCGGETYILPTLSILESIRPKAGMVRTLAGQAELLHIRGKTYPHYRLSDLLEIPNALSRPEEAHAVIVESGSHSFSLQVDDVVSQQQVVIKGLEKQIRTRIFSGAAILSDGRIGLIINIDEVVATLGHEKREHLVGVA
ncbi:MAG: chemotaxis protein CheA [Myxococcales bacterium]|nr:chemotaxis protein CheA [Myxococcales bacterium]